MSGWPYNHTVDPADGEAWEAEDDRLEHISRDCLCTVARATWWQRVGTACRGCGCALTHPYV